MEIPGQLSNYVMRDNHISFKILSIHIYAVKVILHMHKYYDFFRLIEEQGKVNLLQAQNRSLQDTVKEVELRQEVNL